MLLLLLLSLLLKQDLLEKLGVHVFGAWGQRELDLVYVLVEAAWLNLLLYLASTALLSTSELLLAATRLHSHLALFRARFLLANFLLWLSHLLLLVLVEHLLVLVIAFIFVFFVFFDLLLAALDLHALGVVVFVLTLVFVSLPWFLLLEQANLVPQQIEILIVDYLTEVLLGKGELLWMLIVFLLQVLEQQLLLVVVEFVQVDHHLVIGVALGLQLLLVLILLLLLAITFLMMNLLLLLLCLLLHHHLIVLNLHILVIFKAVVRLFRLVVHCVLLHNKLLQLAHLITVQVQAHLLCGSDQVWVDRCRPVHGFSFFDAFLLVLVLIIIVIVNIIIVVNIHLINIVLEFLLLVMKVLLAVASRLLLSDNLLYFLISLVGLPSVHKSGLCHLDLVLVLELLLCFFVIVFIIILVLQLVPHV